MRQHNLSFCVRLYVQCGFVPYVCQKAEWVRASSGERTMLCTCAGRPPSISCVKIGDLGVQLEGFRFSQKQHCSFQSKKKTKKKRKLGPRQVWSHLERKEGEGGVVGKREKNNSISVKKENVTQRTDPSESNLKAIISISFSACRSLNPGWIFK